MNKSDLQSTVMSLESAPPPTEPIQATNRKMILVAEDIDDEAELALRILAAAKPLGLNIVLLGLYLHPEDEALLRRKLITTAALIREGCLPAEIRTESERGWIEKIKAIHQPCDLLACYTGTESGLIQKPLKEILADQFDSSIYLFEAPATVTQKANSIWRQLISWGGSLAILAGFFWLQTNIPQPAQNLGRTLLMLCSIAIEIGLLFVWNTLTA